VVVHKFSGTRRFGHNGNQLAVIEICVPGGAVGGACHIGWRLLDDE
jgi:hypothetical protein